jgi:hypothetical protein
VKLTRFRHRLTDREAFADAGVVVPSAQPFLASLLGEGRREEGGLPIEAVPLPVAGQVEVVAGDVVASDGLERVTTCVAHDAVTASNGQDPADRGVGPRAVGKPVDRDVRLEAAGAGVEAASTIGVHERHDDDPHRQRRGGPGGRPQLCPSVGRTRAADTQDCDMRTSEPVPVE